MKIAIVTSGGNAPGMNAAVRAVARAAYSRSWEVVGAEEGYGGLLDGRMQPLDQRLLEYGMHRGGTVFGTDRPSELKSPEGRKRVVSRLREAQIEGLVVVGGGGSLAGALSLSELGVAVVGIPATVDNDVFGTELSIGADTALNTAVGAIYRIKDTAWANPRASVVKVGGSGCGYLALTSAIAGGAEAVVVPEFETRPEDLLRSLKEAYEWGKPLFVVVVAEGTRHSAEELCEYLNAAGVGYEADLTDLIHILRGGSPTAFDQMLAARLGAAAVQALADREHGTMVALRCDRIERLPLKEIVGKQHPLDPTMYELVQVLAETPNPSGSPGRPRMDW